MMTLLFKTDLCGRPGLPFHFLKACPDFLLLGVLLLCVGLGCAGNEPVVRVEFPSTDVLADIQDNRVLDEDLEQSDLALGGQQQFQNLLSSVPVLSVTAYQQRYPSSYPEDGSYRVGPEDTLSVYLEEDPEFSREELTVDPEGFLQLPLIGLVSVEGLNKRQITALIKEQLVESDFFIDPHVSVVITSYQSKQVLAFGDILEPGPYAISPGERIMELIFRIGKENIGNNLKKVLLVRSVDSESGPKKIGIEIDIHKLVQAGEQAQNLLLADGDIVYFPESQEDQIYMLGQVKQAGAIAYPQGTGLSLVEAIGQAGGFTRLADPSRVRVIRRNRDENKIFHVNVRTIIEKGLKEQDIQLKPQDIVFVPESLF